MKEQETHADIIAEMLGARPEFPFVYLIGEPDTPEVIDFRTKKIMEPRKINIRRVTVKELAYRLESAHKREAGDAAKLREALVKCREIALQWQADEAAGVAGTTDKPHARSAAEAVVDMEFEINAALSATPRNCDRFATVDEARKAHEVICEKYGKCHNGCPLNNEEHYSAFDCFEAWLFAPATEREGGAK